MLISSGGKKNSYIYTRILVKRGKIKRVVEGKVTKDKVNENLENWFTYSWRVNVKYDNKRKKNSQHQSGTQKRQSVEGVAQRCSVKKVSLEILQNSQENISSRASFLIKLQA